MSSYQRLVLVIDNKYVLLDLENERIYVFRRIDHAVLWSGKPNTKHKISELAKKVFENKDKLPPNLPKLVISPDKPTFMGLMLYDIEGTLPDYDLQVEFNNFIKRKFRSDKRGRNGK